MKNLVSAIACCALCACCALSAWAEATTTQDNAAPSKSADVTIVGRGSRAAEVSKDGQVRELTPGKVNVGKMTPKTIAKPQKPADKPVDITAGELEQEKEKAAKEALKQADIDAIKNLREQQRMWFFDEKGKVMTKEELDKRIERGDISGIKAVDDDRNEWTPKSDEPPAKNDKKSTSNLLKESTRSK